MNMNIIEKRGWFLGISGILVLLSIAAIAVFGFRLGIDLKGGAQWEISVSGVSDENLILAAIKEVGNKDASIKKSGEGTFFVRLPDITEEEHQQYFVELTKRFGTVEEKNFSSIGPAIGSELRTKSMWAIAFVLLGISLYVAWAFRKVSRPIKSWKYGIATLLSLFHDVVIPAGMLAMLGYFMGVEIDTNSIVALLVVMGFSVHDTIVVFDRIRENIVVMRGKTFSLGEIIDKSVNETIVRSVNTSLTLIIILVALLIFGPPSLFYFVLTILVGTLFGTYSSIFVASPLLYVWERLGAKSTG